MEGPIFYNAGITEASGFARKALARQGYVFSEDITNATHILLDTPFNGTALPPGAPDNAIIIGGNLPQAKQHTIDLLKDPQYLAENANITAHCAVKLALEQLSVTLCCQPVLVIGWGRIGKCLADLLRKMGAVVTVSARKPADRAILTALGYRSVDIAATADTANYRLICNTVPELITPATDFPAQSLKLELASKPGIVGENIIDGRRLPNRLAPESSGELIARSILRLLPGGD